MTRHGATLACSPRSGGLLVARPFKAGKHSSVTFTVA
jgi:hypothetical protein